MKFFHQYNNETQIIHNQILYYEPHLHNEIEIISLFCGQASATINGKKYNIEEGDFVIIFPNNIHSYSSGKNIDVGKFIFNPEIVSELGCIFDKMQPNSPIIKKDVLINSGIKELACEIIKNYPQSSEPVKKAYLLLLCGKLLEYCVLEKNSKTDNDTILEIFDYCKQNYHNNITLQNTADSLHISKSTLSKIFSCKLKINFRSYINMLRINEATKLLLKTNMNITEIAYTCGFGCLRSFNRAFQCHIGISPKKYRIKIQSKIPIKTKK